MIRILDGRSKTVDNIMKKLARPSHLEFGGERDVVNKILQDIKVSGDVALLDYTNKFDKTSYKSINEILVSEKEIEDAYNSISPELLEALKKAAENIKKYHEKQVTNSWITFESDGVILGHRITPIARVGIYVPGGRTSYPSSVLMNAIPAKVANVKEIIMVTPPGDDGKIDPAILAAAKIASVDKIYKMGGAQAVGALAYGTQTVEKVDKIVGPGNIYVTLAKKEVFGFVDIDMLAGPSEILVIADDTANPAFIAADLLSQAEHDPLATSILVTDSYELVGKVKNELENQTKNISTIDTIKASLSKYGCIIVVNDMSTAIQIANDIAPEHLEIMTENRTEHLNYIKNAGSIFIGPFTPEPVGDYMAGSNHVLPTSGTAKFSSSLGVDDFVKRSNIIKYTEKALSKTYRDVACIARAEGFEAHARSVEVRFGKNGIPS